MIKYSLKCYSKTGEIITSQKLICNSFKEAILIAYDIWKKSNIHIKKIELTPYKNAVS